MLHPGHKNLEPIGIELAAAYPAVHRLSYIRPDSEFVAPIFGDQAEATRFFPAAFAR
jgi:hypothetical protein